MYWGLGNYPLRRSFAESGSALFTLGFERPSDLPTEVLMFTEAAVGLGLLALTTYGHAAYLVGVEGAFGSEIDYAMLQKLYGTSPEAETRYSPAECIGIDLRVIQGDPDPDHISTSYIERQNLTMRMGMRRFTTRLPPPWLRGSRTTSGRCGRSRPFSTENRPCYARVPWTGSRCSASLP